MTPEERKVYAVLHEHLQTHFADDLKILVSTHSALIAAVIIGFIGIIVMTWRLLFGSN